MLAKLILIVLTGVNIVAVVNRILALDSAYNSEYIPGILWNGIYLLMYTLLHITLLGLLIYNFYESKNTEDAKN